MMKEKLKRWVWKACGAQAVIDQLEEELEETREKLNQTTEKLKAAARFDVLVIDMEAGRELSAANNRANATWNRMKGRNHERKAEEMALAGNWNAGRD